MSLHVVVRRRTAHSCCSYAPWCGYCKKLAPLWEDVATALKGEVNVAKIDVSETADARVGRRFGVRGFPTVKLYVSDVCGSSFL